VSLFDLASNAAQVVTFETSFTPPITINKPLAQGGKPSLIGQLFRPKITIQGDLGTKIIQPYGQPGDHWQAAAVAVMIAAALLSGLVIRGLR
jgi:hypothetical protein